MKKMAIGTMTGAFVLAASLSSTTIGFASEKKEQVSQEQSVDFPEFQGPVTIGDEGEIVKMAQTQLTRLGYETAVDGVFGQETMNNVIAFQEHTLLEKDGIVGVLTYQALMYNI